MFDDNDYVEDYDFTLLDIFSENQDFRIDRQKKHELLDIIVIVHLTLMTKIQQCVEP